MEILNLDVLEKILVDATDREVENLYRNPELKEGISIIYSRPDFWKRRCEVVLDTIFPFEDINWHALYVFLVKTLELFPLKEGETLADVLKTNKEKIEYNKDLPYYFDNVSENVLYALVLLSILPLDFNRNVFFRTAIRGNYMQLFNFLYPRINDAEVLSQGFSSACFYNNMEVFKILMKDPRVDINYQGNGPAFTPLVEACERGNIEIVKLLLADERFNDFNPNAISTAIHHNHAEVVKLLLQDGRIIPSYWSLIVSIEKKNWNIANTLLDDGRILIAGHESDVVKALCKTKEDNIELLERILNMPGFRPYFNKDKCLDYASTYNEAKIMLKLLEIAGEREISKGYVKHYMSEAVQNNNYELFKYIDTKFRPNIQDEYYRTTNLDIIKYLVEEKGFDPSDNDNIFLKTSIRLNVPETVIYLMQFEEVRGGI